MLINVIHAVIQSPALLLFEPLLHARTRVRARYNGYNEEGGRVQETGRALLCPPPSSRIPFRLREFRVPSKKKKARRRISNVIIIDTCFIVRVGRIFVHILGWQLSNCGFFLEKDNFFMELNNFIL